MQISPNKRARRQKKKDTNVCLSKRQLGVHKSKPHHFTDKDSCVTTAAVEEWWQRPHAEAAPVCLGDESFPIDGATAWIRMSRKAITLVHHFSSLALTITGVKSSPSLNVCRDNTPYAN